MQRRSATSCVLLLVSAAACDPAIDPTTDRSAAPAESAESADDSESEEPAAAGGGFPVDPSCDYECIGLDGSETVCVQLCPDGCATFLVQRVDEGDGSVMATESVFELCPDTLPEEDLWGQTCALMYGEPPTSDCNDRFSNEACAVALDECLAAAAD